MIVIIVGRKKNIVEAKEKPIKAKESAENDAGEANDCQTY